DERHYNTVIVDHAGFFMGHRDAHTELLEGIPPSIDRNYWIFYEDSSTIEKTENVQLALLVSRTDRWVIDIVCPKTLNVSETATIIIDRIEEAQRVYNDIPQPMEVRIADMNIHAWISDRRVLCVSFTNGALKPTIDSIASIIVDQNHDSIVPQRRMVNVIFRILESNPKLSPSILSRIMNEDMLFTVFHTPYEDRIPSIVERTASRHPIAKEILGPLLRGYTTLIEALEDKYSSRYEEIFNLIDFVNRRKLLG
ncbi:MAG: hypothetical protein IH631_09265, partial [Candidatus Thorarchaeota archaeon]|nr:hypothetical protein [Candidatus Thorarchaeota archaeon]